MSTTVSQDILSHLKQIVSRIVEGNFYDPLRVFESTSERIRNEYNKRKLRLPAEDTVVDPPVPDLKPISSNPDFDILESFGVLNLLGLGLNDIEAFAVADSLTGLRAAESGFAIEFWGKVTTTSNHDYYIAHASNGDPNEIKYFVTSGIQGEWVLLDKPSDKQMHIATYSRYHFTGDLDTPVRTHPVFMGTERLLLSAIVRHITAACAISASNLEGTEPSEELLPALHCYPGISLGRFSHALNGPLDKRERHNWHIRYEGDPNTYVGEAKLEEIVTHGYTVIESRAWPGFAFIICGYLKQAIRVYNGDGMSAYVRENFLLPYPLDPQSNYPNQKNDEYVPPPLVLEAEAVEPLHESP